MRARDAKRKDKKKKREQCWQMDKYMWRIKGKQLAPSMNGEKVIKLNSMRIT